LQERLVEHRAVLGVERLLGQEVLPAMREISTELGLDSPFEADAPVSLAYSAGTERVAATG